MPIFPLKNEVIKIKEYLKEKKSSLHNTSLTKWFLGDYIKYSITAHEIDQKIKEKQLDLSDKPITAVHFCFV